MKDWFNKNCKYIFATMMIILMVLLCITQCSLWKNKQKMDEIEFIDSSSVYNKIYYETTINSLKKDNKELYDSLKKSKDKIDFLIQFTAKKEYDTGKVHVKPGKATKKDTVYINNPITAKEEAYYTYEYKGNPSDTLNYSLQVNAKEEPRWYRLNMKTSEKYTIVNKEYENGMNHVTVNGGNGNDISNVTVFKKKEKNSFLKRFAVGPTISYGYNVQDKKLSPIIGVGVTFNLLGNK